MLCLDLERGQQGFVAEADGFGVKASRACAGPRCLKKCINTLYEVKLPLLQTAYLKNIVLVEKGPVPLA
jgi:hypothetical protein